MDFEELSKIDSMKMYQTYDKWPEIAQESFERDSPKVDVKDIDHIVLAGTGGSGAIGDIISAILSKTNIHVNVVKGYLLPKTVDENTLVVATSVSGNTKETLTILQNAGSISSKFIAFSSGGDIMKYSRKNNIPFYQIPQIHSPRASLPNFLYSMLNVLQDIIPIRTDDVKQSIELLKKTRDLIYSQNLNEKNPSLSLAEWITGIPVIYFPAGLIAAAIRFKNSLQENSKLHVITEDVIEACHNGIVSWERSSNAQPILIEGTDDYVKTKERWDILKDYFNGGKIEYKEIRSVKGGILSKIMNLNYLLDYSSIYHAILCKIDPSPVNSIDFVKKRL